MSRIAERLEALSQRFSGASWLELWRHLGFVKMLLLALAVFLPLFKYSILPKLWNWEELLETRPEARKVEIRAPRIRLTDARVRWVENVPARSGGVVQSQKAQIYLDDVKRGSSRAAAACAATSSWWSGRARSSA